MDRPYIVHHPDRGATPPLVPRVIRLACAAAGGLLVAAAVRADGRFFERHVLEPYYFLRPAWLAPAVRLAAAAAGVALAAIAGPALARLAVRRPPSRPSAGSLLRVGLALVAAFAASEVVLRIAKPREARALYPRWEFKVGVEHPRYGWMARPNQATVLNVSGGGSFTYAVAGDGRRVPALGARRDDARPALVVIGESIAAGYGLDYDDTFAALAGRALGLEVIDIAEGGYAPDQAYLRLTDLLPRVSRPAAVVSTFVPIELGRMLHDGYPRLGLAAPARAGDGALVLEPPARGWLAALRLRDVLHNRFPYAGDAALERALGTTRAVLLATAAAARARGAAPLFVIPSLGPPRALDDHPEGAIVRALFVDTGLPFVLVDLDASEILPVDGHPNARGARKLARAIQAALPLR